MHLTLIKKLTTFTLSLILLYTVLFSYVSTISAQTACPTVPQNAAKASTTLVIKEAGSYKVWTRMRNEDDFNAYYLQIMNVNNNCATIVGDAVTPDVWTWVDYKNGSPANKIIFNLQPGTYTLNMIAKEPRVGIDKLIVTKELSCIPVDMGTNCESVPMTATPIPIPTATSIPTPTKLPMTSTPVPTRITTPIISITKVITLTPTRIPTNIPTPTGVATLNLPAIADTFTNEDRSTKNYGTARVLYVDGSPERVTYFKFDLANTQLQGRTLTSAALKFRVAKGASGKKGIHFVSQNTWSETGMTYRNRAPLSTTIVGTMNMRTEADQWVTIPLTINNVQTNIGKTYSIAIQHESDYRFEIYSRETSSKPTLILKYR